MSQKSEEPKTEKSSIEISKIGDIDTPKFDKALEKIQENLKVLESYKKFKDPRSLIRNPLSEVTRKERKGLLASTLLSFIIAILNIKPEEISAIGFKFSVENVESFYFILLLLVSYFLVAFISYALSDFIEWRLAINEATKKLKSNLSFEAQEEDDEADSILEKKEIEDLNFNPSTLEKAAKPISYFRALTEFVVPILFALITLILIACIYYQPAN